MPGARDALRAYDRIDPNLRARFESILTRLTEIAVKAQRRVAAEFVQPQLSGFDRRILREDDGGDAGWASPMSRSLINEGVKPRAAGPKPVPVQKAGR